MSIFNKGHKVIDAEKLNDFLKEILPEAKFDRNFIAYKIAENEDKFTFEYSCGITGGGKNGYKTG